MTTNSDMNITGYERGKFFREVQVWPLAEVLNYEGWLSNFSDEEKGIASKLLDFFTYYPKSMVDQMLITSVGRAGKILQSYFSDWDHDHFKKKCVYSFIPGETPNPTDSGNLFARKLREALNIPQNKILDNNQLYDFLEQQPTPIPVIFVDDIVGSGAQCNKAWTDNFGGSKNNTFQQIAKSHNHKFVYAPLIINKKGYNRLKMHCPELILSPAHIIGDEYNLFNKDCICWKDETEFKAGTELILRKSTELGIKDDNSEVSARGFGGQGLGVAFEHGAPDAIPAIFYWEDECWTPLIKKSYER